MFKYYSRAKSADNTAALINAEAFGSKGMKPKYFYSTHNLEMKYDTKSAAVIVRERMEIAARFGYDPETQGMSSSDKEKLRDLDYMDALLITYRQRVLHALQNERYMINLSAQWDAKNILEQENESRWFAYMLENFIRSMVACSASLKDIFQSSAPSYIKAWADELKKQMEEDGALYRQLYEEIANVVENKIEAI